MKTQANLPQPYEQPCLHCPKTTVYPHYSHPEADTDVSIFKSLFRGRLAAHRSEAKALDYNKKNEQQETYRGNPHIAHPPPPEV